MLDFIYKLNENLPSWPVGTRWSLNQLSTATETSIPHVLQYLTEGLGADIDLTTTISRDEAAEAMLFLSKKMQPEIERREKDLAKKRQESVNAYNVIMRKVNSMQIAGNWRGAFRTLSYFAGVQESFLPPETLLNICSETMRSGIKCSASMQEISFWLQKGTAVALSFQTPEGIDEALDLIDAYRDYFLYDESGKGLSIIGNILSVLEEPAAHFERWEAYKKLVGDLYPAA